MIRGCDGRFRRRRSCFQCDDTFYASFHLFYFMCGIEFLFRKIDGRVPALGEIERAVMVI